MKIIDIYVKCILTITYKAFDIVDI